LIRDVVEIVRKNGSLQSVTSVKSRKLILNFIQKHCNSCTWDSAYIALLESEVVNFSLVLSRKWLKSYRKFDKFYTMNTEWQYYIRNSFTYTTNFSIEFCQYWSSC